MKRKKVLITGSNGMLGKDVVNELGYKGEFDIYGINRSKANNSKVKDYICDLTDFNMLKRTLNLINPDIIIHCAANVNVDFCEQNKNYAYQVNAESTRVLASYNPLKSKFIYISTDSIFDGETGDYREEDIPDPLNYYAFTKLEGEKLALQENPNSIIIRTNIYGFHIPQVGNSLAEWALRNLENEISISGFNDVFFNPIYTTQLAKVISVLISTEFNGLIHVGCKEKLSKYDFLIKLAEIFNIDKAFIGKKSVDSLNFKAKRPKDTTLNTIKFNSIMNCELKIDEGIKALYEDYRKTDFIGE